MIDIRMLTVAAAGDGPLVAELTDLINAVYKVAEDGIWVDGASRTSVNEMADLIEAGEIAVARLDGRLVGAVRLRRLPGGEGEFGMLVAAPGHRGAGIGRELVRYAEGWCRERGLATMQLELLVPRTWSHPVKDFLRDWYTRIGYRKVRAGGIEESYPDLAPLLATPCDFVIYHKELGAR